MHAYRQYVQAQMDERGWDRSEMSRRSGLSRQQLHRILTDDRPRLPERPEPATVSAIAKAFGGDSERVLWIKIAEAMGLPVELQQVADVRLLSDEELLRELRNRLLRGRQAQNGPPLRRLEAHQDDPQPVAEAALTVDRPEVPAPATSEEPDT